MGGRGSNGASSIKPGQGIRATIQGKEKVYWIDASGKLRGLQDARAMQGDGIALAKKMIANGATPLSEKKIAALKSARAKERAKTPDYETGNPFGERGRGNTVYRPRKRR